MVWQAGKKASGAKEDFVWITKTQLDPDTERHFFGGDVANTPNDWRSGTTTMNERYKFVFENNLLTDVCFSVGRNGEKIKANRTILSVSSLVFHTNFSERWASEREITVPDIEPAAFTELLRFIYYEKAELTVDIAWPVLYAAKKYDVDGLRNHCIEYIKSKISHYNACYLLMMARFFDEEELIELCLQKINDDTYLAIYKGSLVSSNKKATDDFSKGFLHVDEVTLTYLLELDSLTIEEFPLFLAVLKWSEAECCRSKLPVNIMNQKDVLKDIVQLIRFPLMTVDEFSNKVADSGILTDKEVLSLYAYFNKKRRPSIDFSDKPRSVNSNPLLRIFRRKLRRCMNIHVTNVSTGVLTTLVVNPEDNIKDIKRMLQGEERLRTSCQNLTYKGVRLLDNQTLSKYDIKEGSTIELVVSLFWS